MTEWEATAHANQAAKLLAEGRFGESAAEARIALDLAYQHAPHLAWYVHMVLAEISGSAGE